MVSYFDTVFDIFERDHPIPDDVWPWARWENMLEYLDHPLTKLGCEALKDQVRVAFRDGATGRRWNIGTEDDIVQRERCGWAMGEVRDGHGGGRASVFVEEDNVGE